MGVAKNALGVCLLLVEAREKRAMVKSFYV
jgi:hypothetical protein